MDQDNYYACEKVRFAFWLAAWYGQGCHKWVFVKEGDKTQKNSCLFPMQKLCYVMESYFSLLIMCQ